MYVYKETEPFLWTVGFYRPDGEWESESNWGIQHLAIERVAILNGGGVPTRAVTKRSDKGQAKLEQAFFELAYEIVEAANTHNPEEDFGDFIMEGVKAFAVDLKVELIKFLADSLI